MPLLNPGVLSVIIKNDFTSLQIFLDFRSGKQCQPYDASYDWEIKHI